MEGLLPTSVKIDSTPSKSHPAALARKGCGFATKRKPESLTNWSFEGVPWDGLATGPVPRNYAHGARACAERGASRWLPNKMAMAQAAYFVAQQIYAGWAFFRIVLFGALIANLAHAIVLRKLGRSFGYALAHSCLLLLTS